MNARAQGLKIRFLRFTVTMAASATALSACSTAPGDMVTPAVSAETAHALSSRLDEFCIAQQWTRTCRIPEYTDDQRLNNGSDEYGPKASAVPAEDLERRGSPQMFVGRAPAVGGIEVDTTGGPGNLPQTYQNLHLVPGLNCVYLEFQLASGWTGYVIPAATSGPKPCPDTTGLSNPLPVTAVHTPGFPMDADVPGVIRFHEGIAGISGTPQPLVGVKCAEKWCLIHPAGTQKKPPPHQGMNASNRVWVVPGWGDAQRLAIRPAGSTHPRYGTNTEASIIPAKGANYTTLAPFEGKWIHSATVVFKDDPEGTKYKTQFGFAKGRNKVMLKKIGNDWFAKVEHRSGFMCVFGCTTYVGATRKAHSTMPPATARFQWDPLDEGLWVRCADGCCKVSGT